MLYTDNKYKTKNFKANDFSYCFETKEREFMNMFEIKKPQSSNKTIRMPDELIAEIEKIASDKDISFNQLVIQCCQYALKNLKNS